MNEEERNQHDESSKFKVTDRRMFTAEGEPIPAADATAGAAAPPKPAEKPREPDPQPQAPPPEPDRGSVPRGGIDFSTFIISLATSAMAYLGEVPDPATGQRMQSLEGAQQMIEILSILQDKTKGNLEAEEAQLLEEILYELRMKYLAKAKVINL